MLTHSPPSLSTERPPDAVRFTTALSHQSTIIQPHLHSTRSPSPPIANSHPRPMSPPPLLLTHPPPRTLAAQRVSHRAPLISTFKPPQCLPSGPALTRPTLPTTILQHATPHPGLIRRSPSTISLSFLYLLPFSFIPHAAPPRAGGERRSADGLSVAAPRRTSRLLLRPLACALVAGPGVSCCSFSPPAAGWGCGVRAARLRRHPHCLVGAPGAA